METRQRTSLDGNVDTPEATTYIPWVDPIHVVESGTQFDPQVTQEQPTQVPASDDRSERLFYNESDRDSEGFVRGYN